MGEYKTIFCLYLRFSSLVYKMTVQNINAEILAKTFMEGVALSFVMIEVIVLGADSKFSSVLEEMCTELKIHF